MSSLRWEQVRVRALGILPSSATIETTQPSIFTSCFRTTKFKHANGHMTYAHAHAFRTTKLKQTQTAKYWHTFEDNWRFPRVFRISLVVHCRFRYRWCACCVCITVFLTRVICLYLYVCILLNAHMVNIFMYGTDTQIIFRMTWIPPHANRVYFLYTRI